MRDPLGCPNRYRSMGFPSLVVLLLAIGPTHGPRPCRAARSASWELFATTRTTPSIAVSSPNWPQLNAKREWFAGRFTFTVVQQSPVTPDSIRRGSLEVLANSQERSVGTSDIDFRAWRIPGAAYSAASRDSTRPGVLVEHDKQGRVLLTISGANLEDAGILFAVFEADSSGFSGMWESGAAVTPSYKGVLLCTSVSWG